MRQLLLRMDKNKMLVMDLKKTFTKFSGLKIISEKKIDDDSLMLRIEYENDTFFILLRPFLDDYMVINVSNPISYKDKDIEGMQMKLANKYNMLAIATKCYLVDSEKKNYMFIREEIIRAKDIFNKDMIESRVKLAISLVQNSLSIFEECIKEEMADEQKEKQ